MADSTQSAVHFLEELRKERNELDTLIHALEKRLGISSGHQVIEPDDEREHGKVPPPVTSLPIGFFHNLSQAAAAEKLLRMNPNQPYSTGEILEAFRNSRMQLNPKNAVTILYTALKRSYKFERVGNKKWGLKEWYPDKKKRLSKEPDSLEDEKGT
jgi:hypothetical protein